MGNYEGKTTAQAIIDALEKQGVRYVFGIPGVHNIDLYDALADSKKILPVITRHEQGAAFMADGYARVSGELAAAFVITGPGLTNAFTGIAEAYWDSSPIAVFTTEIGSQFIGLEKGFIHELPDQKGIIESVVKHAVRITDPNQAENLTSEALAKAVSGRQRPVYVEIPLDILPSRTEPQAKRIDPTVVVQEQTPELDPAALQKICSILKQAKRPVIYAGGGVNNHAAGEELTKLAEKIGAPVVSTVKGKGAIANDHPLYVGVSWAKEVMESELLQNADVLFAIGTRLSARLKYGGYGNFTLPETIIHVDIDPKVIGQNFPTEVGVCADAVKTMRTITTALEISPETRQEGFARSAYTRKHIQQSLEEKAPVIAQALAGLRQSLPREAIIVGDNALMGIWAARYFPSYQPRTFLFPMGYGTLGFAVPAAIGARFAKPDVPVVALVGDGGFMFSSQELSVAIQNQLDLTVIVMNDNKYGSVDYNQRKKFGRVIATDLQNPDFQMLAQAFGCRYFVVSDPLQLFPSSFFQFKAPTP